MTRFTNDASQLLKWYKKVKMNSASQESWESFRKTEDQKPKSKKKKSQSTHSTEKNVVLTTWSKVASGPHVWKPVGLCEPPTSDLPVPRSIS